MTRTTRLEDLKPSRTNDRVAPGECVTLQTVQWFGTDAVEVIYKRAAGNTNSCFPARGSSQMQASKPLDQAVDAREPDPKLKSAKPRSRHLRSLAGRAAYGVLVAVAGLLALPLQAEAQTTLVSNTGRIRDVTTVDNRDRAQAFTTGANSGGYTLSSIEIFSGDDEGDDAAVSVCTVDVNGFATSTCTALTAPSSFAAGTLEFTGNMTLAATTTYTLLVTSPGGENLGLGTTSANGEDTGGATGWTINNTYDIKSTSDVWGTTASGRAFRIAVKGTVVGTTLSTDATLSDLALDGATGSEPIPLSPVFDSATETYTTAVANRIDAMTLTATKTNANATVAITNDGDTSTPGDGGTEPQRRVQHGDGDRDGRERRHEDLHDHGDAGQRPTRTDRLPRRHRLVHHYGRGVHEPARRSRSTLNIGGIGAELVYGDLHSTTFTHEEAELHRFKGRLHKNHRSHPETRSLSTN